MLQIIRLIAYLLLNPTLPLILQEAQRSAAGSSSAEN